MVLLAGWPIGQALLSYGSEVFKAVGPPWQVFRINVLMAATRGGGHDPLLPQLRPTRRANASIPRSAVR